MTNKNLYTAMNGIDPELIRQAAPTGKAKRIWPRWVAAAACLCLIVSICAAFWKSPAETPYTDQAYLSAEAVGNLFQPNREDSPGSTSAYTKVYRPESKPLELSPLPAEEYVPIYKISNQIKALSQTELYALSDRVLPKLSDAMGIDMKAYERNETGRENENLTLTYRTENLVTMFEQTSGRSDYGITFSANHVWINPHHEPLEFNGQRVQIDLQQSEEEILASLEWVRDFLFDAFGRTFEYTKITFSYSSSCEYAEGHIYVYYYDETPDGRMGDYIRLYFDNYANSSAETVSTGIVDNCDISYYSYRVPLEKYYPVEANCRLLSLEEAEELLEKGYVFGGHACPLCMAAQDKVSFEGYDYVGFEYVADYWSDTPRSIPFYAFYKKIDTHESGNIIYAKTYVCAVEVSGMEEYFINQSSSHLED